MPLDPQAFAYDAVGNRTTNGSVTNAGNQLTADSNVTYQYDDNGNLTRKTLLATGNYTQYSYDAENRLVKVEEFAAGNPTAITTSTYRYDGLGRRIEKVANGLTTRYVYDGEDILLEYDGSNILQARYTHGPGIDEPIAVTQGASTFLYHQDGLGSVTELTDSTGSLAKAYAYDAYGNILESPGTVNQPYTYTGRELDQETGLYYYRARYYDAATGKFLQKDPIGLHGGLNPYSYVLSNPINRVDPSGLYTSARWLAAPRLTDINTKKVGNMGFGEYWTLIPPAIGIDGEWYMLSAEVTGRVECIDDGACDKEQTKDVFQVQEAVGARIGIGWGITTLPRLQAARKVGEAFSRVDDAVEFYRNQWTQLALKMNNNPMTWCTIMSVGQAK